MEKAVLSIVEEFKQTVDSSEITLISEFEKYVNFIVKLMQKNNKENMKKDEESMKNTLRHLVDDIINSDIETKKQKLATDENLEQIRNLSGLAYKTAKDVALGKMKNKVDYDVEEKIYKMRDLLKLVKDYNKEEANKLVSEGILDFLYVKKPETHITSLRLYKIIENK